jgi:hypothetical protein
MACRKSVIVTTENGTPPGTLDHNVHLGSPSVGTNVDKPVVLQVMIGDANRFLRSGSPELR